MKRNCVFVLSVLILILSITTICAAQDNKFKSKEPIKIGYLNPFTGPSTFDTETDVPGIKLAIDEINESGGVLGRPLRLVTRDDKCNPEAAVREARDLLFNEDVFYIAGCTCSGAARAVSAFMKAEKRIFVVDIAKSEKLTADWGHRYIFRATNNAEMEAIAIAKASIEIFGPLKKIYNLSPDYEGGRAAWRSFLNSYKKEVPDVEVVGNIWAKLGTQDFTSYLTAIMNSDAELFFTSFFQSDALSMLKQSIAIGLNGKIPTIGFWHGQPGVTQKFNSEFYPKNTIGGGVFPFWSIENKGALQFKNTVKDKYGVYPGYGASSYAFTKAMANAINKVGSLDTEKIIDVLEDSIIPTPIGELKLRGCDHQLMWPTYVGMIGELEGWDFYGTKNLVSYGEEAYPTCEEIEKLRKK